MNVGAYTLMMLGDLHPWRIVRKDTRRSEYLTGRLLRLLASVFSVLHAPCSVIDHCSTKRYWEMHSMLYVSFPVSYRWCGAVWSTRVLPNAAVAFSTNKRPISWAACMKSFSCDSVPLTLIFLLCTIAVRQWNWFNWIKWLNLLKLFLESNAQTS